MKHGSFLKGKLRIWVTMQSPIICKVCFSSNPNKNGYCIEHSTSGIAYKEESCTVNELNMICNQLLTELIGEMR